MRGGAGGPHEAYSLYVEREADGANEQMGSFQRSRYTLTWRMKRSGGSSPH